MASIALLSSRTIAKTTQSNPPRACTDSSLQPAAEKILTNKAWSYYSAGATDELSKRFPALP
jgi:hypothetical protein